MSEIKITRIDMYEMPNGKIYIEKYPDGWTASTRAVSRKENSEMALDEMIAWLKDNGWKVREWRGGRYGKRGARAWLGKVLPVRSRWGIGYCRDLYTKNRDLLPADIPLNNVDFALDY